MTYSISDQGTKYGPTLLVKTDNNKQLNVRAHSIRDVVVLDLTDDSTMIASDLNLEDAKQVIRSLNSAVIAIEKRVKEREPTERDLFDRIPVGQDFEWHYAGVRSDKKLYKKVSDTIMRVYNEGDRPGEPTGQTFTRSNIIFDRVTKVTFPKPEPVYLRDVIQALPMDTLFDWVTEGMTNRYRRFPGGIYLVGQKPGYVYALDTIGSYREVSTTDYIKEVSS